MRSWRRKGRGVGEREKKRGEWAGYVDWYIGSNLRSFKIVEIKNK